MKRHLAPALFSLSLCAVMGGARTASAQTLNEVDLLAVDSASIAVQAPVLPSAPVEPSANPFVAGAPVIIAPTSMLLHDASAPTAALGIAPTAVMIDWKMPTSRALIIGGTATALIGLFAVGHDTGAIIALSGTAVAVYGLYLHYNR